MPSYEIIETTADIGILVEGETLPELFTQSGKAMFELMIGDLESVEMLESMQVICEADNLEDLFVDWLGQLLYYYDSEKYVFKDFDIIELDENHLIAGANGEKFDPARHELHTAIKAVTYHDLMVRYMKSQRAWVGQVIFDV